MKINRLILAGLIAVSLVTSAGAAGWTAIPLTNVYQTRDLSYYMPHSAPDTNADLAFTAFVKINTNFLSLLDRIQASSNALWTAIGAGGGGIGASNSPSAGDILHSDGTTNFWAAGSGTASSLEGFSPTILADTLYGYSYTDYMLGSTWNVTGAGAATFTTVTASNLTGRLYGAADSVIGKHYVPAAYTWLAYQNDSTPLMSLNTGWQIVVDASGGLVAPYLYGNGAGVTQVQAYSISNATCTLNPSSGVMAFLNGTIIIDADGSGITAPAFIGNGAGLTSLNASAISSGTIDAARLPAGTAGLDYADTTTTSGAETKAITSITAPNPGFLYCNVQVAADGSGDAWLKTIQNVSIHDGTVGTPSVVNLAASGASVSFDVNSGSFRVLVTGVSGQTVAWHCKVLTTAVSQP